MDEKTFTKIEYPLINISRFFMALAVVAIHFNPLYGIWNIGFAALDAWITHVAVPFFFMVSGYFTAKAMISNNWGGVYCKKRSPHT